MKKIICLFALVMLISGCTTADLNMILHGDERGYVVKYGASCESCNRNFTLEDINSSEMVTCPYCGKEQNIQLAINRYKYDKQQQNERERAKILENYQKSMDESNKEYKEKMRISQENISKIFDHKRSTTNCRSNGFGGIVCDTVEN